MAHRFPNPVPSGIRIPQWALLDVAVRSYFIFSMATYSQHLPGRERLELQSVACSWWWESSLFFSSPTINVSPTSHSIDTPEISPGALLGPSGVVTATVAATATGPQFPHSTSAMSFTIGDSPSALSSPSSTGGSSSNTGAIVGGIVGGVAVISIAITAILFSLRRRRPQAPTATPRGTGGSQLPKDEFQRPLTDKGMHTASTLHGDPVVPIKHYVRVFVSTSLSFCSSYALSFLFLNRTRATQPHSLGTKEFHSHRIPLKGPSRCTVGPQTPWPPCRPREQGDIMACLSSDFATRKLSIALHEFGMDSINSHKVFLLSLQSSVRTLFGYTRAELRTGQLKGCVTLLSVVPHFSKPTF